MKLLTETEAQTWTDRAAYYLREALDAIEKNYDDALSSVSAADACLRIAANEMEPDPELMPQPEPTCTCPPDLVARGGWMSTCPLHGR